MIAMLHAYWAFGGLWPAEDPAGLSRTVVGAESEKMPGRALTLGVAALILMAAALPLLSVTGTPGFAPGWFLDLALLGAAAVFVVRGAVTYTRWGAALQAIEPFATLNRRYFSPLCLALGAGFIWVLLA